MIDGYIKILKLVPYGGYVLLAALLVFVVIAICFSVKRFRSGDDVKIFWGLLELKNSPKIEELEKICTDLRQQFEKINENSRQKSFIMKLINIVIDGIADLLNTNGRIDYVQKRNKLYELLLNGIISTMTCDRGNIHRVSIFTPDKNIKDMLSPYKSTGFSMTEIQHIMLPLNNSVAGHVYNSKQPYWTGQVNKDKIFYCIPSIKVEYQSLACVPIISSGDCLGVLSIDGIKIDTFGDDDIAYLKYFASLIAIMLDTESNYEEKQSMKMERRLYNEKEVKGQSAGA